MKRRRIQTSQLHLRNRKKLIVPYYILYYINISKYITVTGFAVEVKIIFFVNLLVDCTHYHPFVFDTTGQDVSKQSRRSLMYIERRWRSRVNTRMF